jgi:poly-gamma-glutamate synthesis protein (capsule biosynthesis protein)
VVGDLMCHSVQYKYAQIAADSFDFTPTFRYVQKYFDESDFLIGNLETVTAGKEKGYSGYPFFNSPDDFITSLKKVGFDLLFTSNNHSLDKGKDGILRTIKILNENQIHYTGTFKSQNDRDSIRIFNINGIKIAFISYSYGTNGNPIPKGNNFLINLIDTLQIKNDILSSRKQESDIVFVYFHFGNEYQKSPNIYQKNIVNKTIEYGADLIVGSHPHTIQPYELFKTNNGKLDTGLIAYSLGNFISNQRWRYSDAGVILNIEITKNVINDSIFISDINFIPTWVYKGEINSKKEYLIFPCEIAFSDTIPAFLDSNSINKIKQDNSDTRKILNIEEYNGHFDIE